MKLEDTVHEIEDLTAALRTALAAGDEPACAPLLQRRGQALICLDSALKAAGDGERNALAARLRGLVEADLALRDAAETALAQVGEAVRAGFGMRRPAGGKVDCGPQQTSLDRLA